ncbi:MAG: hypothetical protein K8R21_06935 [Leptospira sp.]|nr:hypothetical protein [Leptospira sp.]
MGSRINPFSGQDEFTGKHPENMSLTELEMLLHIKRLNVRLDLERIKTQVSYTKLILEGIQELGLLDKLTEFFSRQGTPPSA